MPPELIKKIKETIDSRTIVLKPKNQLEAEKAWLFKMRFDWAKVVNNNPNKYTEVEVILAKSILGI